MFFLFQFVSPFLLFTLSYFNNDLFKCELFMDINSLIR